MALLCVFSVGAYADEGFIVADETIKFLETITTDTGENVSITRPYINIPYGSEAENILIPLDVDDINEHVSQYNLEVTRISCVLHLPYDMQKEGDTKGDYGAERRIIDTWNPSLVSNPSGKGYYDEDTKILTIPIEELSGNPYGEASPRANLSISLSPTDGTAFHPSLSPQLFCRYAPPVSDLSILPSSSYASQKQWVNIGGTFDLTNENFTNDTPIKLYMSNSGGDETTAVGDIVTTTKEAFLAETGAENGVVKISRLQRSSGLMVEGLEAGNYYVTMKIGEGSKATYVTKPYTVYANAKDYSKAAMNRIIGFYMMEPEVTDETLSSMSPPFLTNAGYKIYANKPAEGGYFYEVAQFGPIAYMPYRTGLAYYRDTGTDWEAWILTALGNSYSYTDNSGKNTTLNFSGTGDLLSGMPFLTTPSPAWVSGGTQSWLDSYEKVLKDAGVENNRQLANYFASNKTEPYNKAAFRKTTALLAMGVDPRNPFPGETCNVDHVSALMYTFYDQSTVTWDEDGNADYSQAKLRLNDEGKLPWWNSDPLNISYCMLALELTNASPEEGYTTELRQAFLNSIVPTVEGYVSYFLGETDGEIGSGDSEGGYTEAFAFDVCAMLSLPLFYAADDPVWGEKIEKIRADLPAAYGGCVDTMSGETLYGTNSNSTAMLINSLVSAGYTIEDLENSVFQGTYQTLLSSLVNCQMENGSITYGGGVGNRMSTYQTLGALVDLYNNKSCFTVHRDNYLLNYPQYTDEGHAFTALMAGLPKNGEDLTWDEVVNVVAARNVYTEAYKELNQEQKKIFEEYFGETLECLENLEQNTGNAVAKELAKLGDKEQIQISDQPYIEALSAAYNSLSEEQKADANAEDNSNLSKLRDALVALNMWTAKEVNDFLLSLPAAEDVTNKDRNDIEAARAAYETLKEDQKVLVDANALKALRDAERALETLAAKNVVKAIDDLPSPGDVRLSYRGAIETVRSAYDSLDDEEKAMVTNYTKLQLVEAVLAELLNAGPEEPVYTAQSVIDLINLLPAADKVTAEDRSAIEGARAAYDSLALEEQSLIQADIYKILTDAEAALAALPGETVNLKDLAGKEGQWYYPAVTWCVNNGLFKGDDKGNFNSDNNITRAEFAQMIYNYYKNDTSVMKNDRTVSFTDVSTGDWFYEAVTACGKAGIILGNDNGEFNPKQPIKRQDVSLILMRIIIGQDAIDKVNVSERLAELAKAGYVFSDFDATDAYAQKAMAAAAGRIFFGSDGKLNPQNNITRAETAQVMYNYLKN